MNITRIIVMLAVLAFAISPGAGYLIYTAKKDAAVARLHQEAELHIESLVEQIDTYLALQVKTAASLAGLPELRMAALRAPGAALDQANVILDHFNRAFGLDVCYLIDNKGNTIASSNRTARDSFVGRNYAFRPYFQEAIQGMPTVYMALGVTSKKRGIYCSYPVFATGRKNPVGVVVLKAATGFIEKQLQQPFDGAAALIDPQGVVFIANRPDWDFRTLWKISPERAAEIARTRQFGDEPPAWLGMELTGPHEAIDGSGEKYVMHEKELRNYEGWRIAYFHDHAAVAKQAASMLFGQLGVPLMAFSFLTTVVVFLLARKAFREVRQRKEAEDRLGGLTDRLQALIEASPLPITIVNREGSVELWNPAAERTFGWTEAEVMGKPLPTVPRDRQEEFRSFLLWIFAGQAIRSVETKRIRKDGSIISVALSTAPLHDAAGAITAAMGIYEDITERKQAEDERLKLHKLESLAILAGGIAHDFGNLAASVLNYVTLAKRKTLSDDKAYQFLSKAEVLCAGAKELSDQLIAFSQAGEPVKTPFVPSSVVRDTVLSVLKESAVTPVLSLPDDLPAIAADVYQIKQVITHLVENAREVMHDGGELRVSGAIRQVREGERPPLARGSYVTISIQDTGPGIPEEQLSKIFDPYFSTKDRYYQKGLGLGLAVSYSIMKNHGGLLTVESDRGTGTTFHLFFPVAP